jgi:hypothetical protein
VAVMATLLGAGAARAATPLDDTIHYTNSFDNAASVTSWLYWYGNGSNNNAMTWDSTVDAATNANSGSLLFETTFPPSDQLAWFGTFGNRWGYDTEFRHDATKYTNIMVDIHVDPTSALSQAGTFGGLQIGFYDGPNQIGTQVIPGSATNGWVRIVQPIDPSTPSISSVSGIAFRIQTYNNFDNPIGHVKLWMDNLKMNVSPVKIPPPTLAPILIKPIQGLNLLSSSANGNEFQRTSIVFANHNGVGWLNSPTPMTYALTITNFPAGTYTNYQAHIFITTGGTLASFDTAPDYSQTNVIFFDVHQNPNGTGSAFFRYKVNEEQQNSNMFGIEYIGPASAGTLAGLNASTVFGTWSFTFNQDTNVTVNGPGGVSTNFNMRPVAVSNFAEPLNVLFGAQPNRHSTATPLANVGQRVILSSVGITNGDSTVVYDNFMADSSLDGNLWTRLAGDVNMVQLVPSGSAWWVKWSLPDTGFGLQTSTNFIVTNSWVTLTGPDAVGGPLNSYTASGSRFALVPASALGSTSQNYFRLLQQVFTKLQVLMPGEVAAPGTPSGKTGTPLPQQNNVSFDIIVNSVDNKWFPISSTDVIHLTSNDGNVILPADAALVNGTGTFTVTFGSTGSFTITASDVTDPTKVPNTGSPTTVTQ